MPELKVSEAQVIELARQLSPSGKRKILQSLITTDAAQFEQLVDYGESRAREVAAARGLDWNILSKAQREQLVDELLHEA
jgi:hypothetical protein